MLDVSDVHERIEAAIAIALPTWRASAHGYDEIAGLPDGAERSHLAYVVAALDTAWKEGRQLRAVDTQQYATTTIGVRWLHRVRVELRSADYRAALDEEKALIRAVLATYENPELQIVLSGSATRRELTPAGGPFLLGEIEFSVHHTIALSA